MNETKNSEPAKGAATNERSRRFTQASEAFTAAVEQLDDQAWFTAVPDEQRTAAALIRHAALAWRGGSATFYRIALGKSSIGLTSCELDALNVKHSEQFARADRDETMADCAGRKHRRLSSSAADSTARQAAC